MTRKNKLSKFISSIKTHIHPENTEKLENKKDIDNNVERLLQLIHAEESDTISANSLNKSELASLIEDIHKGYQAIHGRYDELTEKLKKKFHRKGDSDSFSFNSSSYSTSSSDSSDSESENSGKKLGKNHEGEAEMTVSFEDYNALREKVESISRRNNELEIEATSMIERLKKFESIETKLAESQDMNVVLEKRISILEEHIKTLEAQNRDLEQKVYSSVKQEKELKQIMVSLHEEVESLKVEKEEALHKLLDSEQVIEKYISEISQMKNKIMIVESENVSLKHDLEERSQEVADLNQKNCDIEKEKETLISENFQHLSKVMIVESENVSLKHDLEERSQEVADLNQKNCDIEKEKETLISENFQHLSKVMIVESENVSLKHDLEERSQEVADLNQKNCDIEKEKETLISENFQHLSKVMIVESENVSLKRDLEERSQEVADLNQKNCDIEKEKETLISENFQHLSKVQELEKLLVEQRDEANLKLKVSTDESSSVITQLLSEKEKLNLELEAADKSRHELESKLNDAQEENGVLKSEIFDLNTSSETLKNENTRFLTIINDLTKHLEHTQAENNNLATQHREAVQLAEEETQKVKTISLELEEVKNKSSRTDEILRLTLEAKEQEETKMEQLLESLKNEKNALVSENQELLTKVKQSEEEIADTLSKISELEIQKSKLHIRIENLCAEVETNTLQLNDAKNNLEVAGEQIAKLSMENSELLNQLELEKIKLKELQQVSEHLKEENSVMNENKRQLQEFENIIDDLKTEIDQLRSANDQLQTHINDSTDALELANCKLDEFSKQNRVLEEEKCALISKLEQSEACIRTQEKELEVLAKENSMLQQNNEDMHARISALDTKLGERTAEAMALHKRLEDVQHEATSQTQAMSARVNDLLHEIDLLQKFKTKLEDHMSVFREEFANYLCLLEKFDDEVTKKISNQENLLVILKGGISNLHTNGKQLKYQFYESSKKLEVVEAIKEAQILEIQKLVKRVEELQENLNQAEARNAEIIKEVSYMKDQLQAQTCLFKQNLKVTETEYKEKEEKLINLNEKLQRDVMALNDEIAVLSGKLNLFGNDFSRMIHAVEFCASSFCQEFNKLESVFEHKICHMDAQLASFTVETRILKTELHRLLSEKRGMGKEMRDMTMRLMNNEECIKSLKLRTGDLEDQLTKKDKEKELLRMIGTKAERRLEELEKSIKEKEEEIVTRKNEKIEVINQLCLMIDYQQEKYSQLNAYLKTTRRFAMSR